MRNGGDCRTAPATPGMLIIQGLYKVLKPFFVLSFFPQHFFGYQTIAKVPFPQNQLKQGSSENDGRLQLHQLRSFLNLGYLPEYN